MLRGGIGGPLVCPPCYAERVHVANIMIAQNFPKARERLEDLKKGGSKPAMKSRERISRSKVGKQNEGECILM